jgi:hypothetical protein
MARGPNKVYTSNFKHKVLTFYQPKVKGSGFKALADRFDIVGGPRAVARWYKKWDGTVKSLNPEPRPGRSSSLSNLQKKRYIKEFVDAANQRGEVIKYRDVQDNVSKKTKVNLSIRHIQRIGKKEFKFGYSLATRSLMGTGIVFHFFSLFVYIT